MPPFLKYRNMDSPNNLSLRDKIEWIIKELRKLRRGGGESSSERNPGLSAVAYDNDYNSLSNKPDLSLKADLENGKIPASQLPSFVDDVLGEISEEASFRADADTKLDDAINLAFAQISQKQKKVTVITITGNTTLSEMHNGAILHITNSCTLTFAANLGKDFNFVEKAIGSIIVQHVAASGVTLNSDSGLILKNGAMGSVYAPSNNNFILTGTYTTS